MKKLMMMLWVMLLPVLMFAAAGTEILGDTQAATTQTGTLIGTLLFVVVVSVWVLPIVFGVMVYSSQKKKAEQQHEDVGIKAALFALIAIVIGAAGSYYVVGSIGRLASGATDLGAGNTYFLKPLFDQGKKGIKGT